MNHGGSVAVVVPVYNAENHLRQCLESLRTQTLGSALHVLIVLDAPTDGSAAIAKEYAAEDERFQVLELEENAGLAGARQAGLDRADAEYVGFVDSDDWCAPSMFAALREVAQRDEADIVSCAFTRVASSGVETVVPFPVSALTDADARRQALLDGHTNRMLWFAWRNLYRSDLLQSNGIGFDPALRTGEDMPFILAAFGAAERCAVVDEPLYFYRETPNSLTTAPHVPYLVDCLQRAHDRKFEAARAAGLPEHEFRANVHRYVVMNLLPRMLANEIRGGAERPREAVEGVLRVPMVWESVRSVSIGAPGLGRGHRAVLALAKTRQHRALAKLVGR